MDEGPWNASDNCGGTRGWAEPSDSVFKSREGIRPYGPNSSLSDPTTGVHMFESNLHGATGVDSPVDMP